jgi:hypothetical protein
VKASLATDVVEFLLDGKTFKGWEGLGKKEPNSAVENGERVMEGSGYLFRRPLYGWRIWDAPMRGHGMSGPYWADFICGVVADSEYEMDRRSAGFGELIP